ncbi:PTS ascorbate transporter subunit IIC [Tissierella creatinophila]|uniref:Ascorbate-specific PTS system EIIC component n=1 Tax=Tissierella creatinophila DSM 6911 TaxID=1123403 RepID=A0A1U7M7D7_TISCR|nr:PTS ascorbate transporter subunit IIC [Tissierella creatinophila]OLS03201.1 ascorbate-specific permease IIC component UlaA [Tissierella creatinophila DSM 6911]
MNILKIISQDILTQPSLLIGLISLIGLLALKKPFNKVMTGTLKPILGFLMLGAGADFIVSNLNPLGQMIEHGFNITGVIPNNEAIVAIAQDVLGKETMLILLFGLLFNLVIARFTKFKYIFLTGHHSFFMACLLSAVLSTGGLSGALLVLVGGFMLGAWSAISPAIGQNFTLQVTEGDNIAMGHFGSLGYYISAWVGKFVGKPEDSTEDIEIPEKYGFLRDTTISTAITMMVFYLIAAIAAGSDFVVELSGGTNFIVFAIMSALKFAVGVTIVYNGVRMILGELIPAFEGISRKLIPNAVPAVDCAVFFTYAPTAVIIGFISSFIGGIVGMLILGFAGGVLIIPGLVPHFFCGATAGIYGNATGGKKGAVVGSFVNGLGITFLPALLLPVLGQLGFQNTTFGDFDFGVIGIVVGKAADLLGSTGIYIIAGLFLLALIIPSFMKTKSPTLNNDVEAYE